MGFAGQTRLRATSPHMQNLQPYKALSLLTPAVINHQRAFFRTNHWGRKLSARIDCGTASCTSQLPPVLTPLLDHLQLRRLQLATRHCSTHYHARYQHFSDGFLSRHSYHRPTARSEHGELVQ